MRVPNAPRKENIARKIKQGVTKGWQKVKEKAGRSQLDGQYKLGDENLPGLRMRGGGGG